MAPVPRWAVAVGKVLGGATIAVFQSMIVVVVAPFAGIYPSPPMAVELLLLCFLISVAVTSLGTAIAAGMRSVQSFQMVMTPTICGHNDCESPSARPEAGPTDVDVWPSPPTLLPTRSARCR
ncbi:MAG: ABC transporter permease [Planctomycetaceae bacterium]|nr:ABC transporter permease [Planctomycetaceae bacterium]